jgi:hypothetical protein
MLSTNLRSLIPDAGAVIQLHKLGLWDKVCSRIGIIVPSIIAHQEVIYYIDPDTEDLINIDLQVDVAEGRITEVAASLADMEEFLDQFDSVVKADLHEGEVEALTLLWKQQVQDCSFCAGDEIAVKALVLLKMSDKGISLEKALQQIGLTTSRLDPQFRDECFQQWVEEAKLQRVYGQGLAQDPLHGSS